MQVSVKREEIADNISFTSIIDRKFKTNVVKVMFITSLNKEVSPLNTFVSMLLSSTNSKYKTNFEMTDKINSLYDSTLRSETITYGDSQVLTFTIGCIDNRFALYGEDILGQLLDILEDCLFSPNAENGKFNEDEFKLRKKDFIDSIYSEINNKRYYAFTKACRSIFKGEPTEYPQYVSLETVENITSEEVYKAYQKLIKTSHIEIYYVSPNGDVDVKGRFKKAFETVERSTEVTKLMSPSIIKPEVLYVDESCDMLQAQVIMAYKTSYENTDVVSIFNRLLGGTAFSKLFTNVREKQSLCYYCSSNYMQSKSTVYVTSGVENSNCGKLVSAVNEQVEAIKNGDFTDEELYNTKLYVINGMKAFNDFPGSLASWYFTRYCFGNIISPEQSIQNIMNVTREQIIEVAQSVVLDTVYTLKAEQSTEEGE